MPDRCRAPCACVRLGPGFGGAASGGGSRGLASSVQMRYKCRWVHCNHLRCRMAQTSITIRTDPELVDKVAALAVAMDRTRNWVVEDALRQYVESQAWQVEGIKDAMASLDQGEGIDHDDVMAEMDALLTGAGAT